MAAQRTIVQRAIRQESEVLLRQLDAYLAALHAAQTTAGSPVDVGHAERMAAALRQLIADTAGSSAVDRARVRAAVHYFVYRGVAGDGPARPGSARLALLTGGRAPVERRRQGDGDRVVNDLLRELGRVDLIVER